MTTSRKHGLRPHPWPWVRVRVCMVGLAMLAALTVPAVTPSPAWAASDPHAHVANANSGYVSVIDTATNTVTTTIPAGDGSEGVAVTPDGTRAYVTNSLSDDVSVIDTATNTVTTTIPVGDDPGDVAVTPDGTHTYVTNSLSNDVSVIDTATNTVTTTIPVGTGPVGVAVTPDGTRAYVTNSGSHNVSVIDTATNTVATTIPVGLNPGGVAVTPDGTRAYIVNFASRSVSVIDTATNTVTTTIPVGTGPARVAVTPDGTRAYVTNPGSDDVWVIDTATNTVTTTIPVGTVPVWVAVTPDGTRAYVTNFFSANVSVIDTATNTVTTTIPVGEVPDGVAVTPDGTRVYVTHPYSDIPAKSSLTVSKSHAGNFTQGQQGTYTITVGNNGPGPTDGTTVTAQDTLPAGMAAASISGTGWSCAVATLTCTRSDVLNAGDSYPPITLTVDVSCDAPPQGTNTATVTGGGDSTTHTATDPTTTDLNSTCQQPSLTIDKSHSGKFTQGQQGTYTITVGNAGPGATDGSRVTVRDTLPKRLTAASIDGTGWSCSRNNLTCTRSDPLPAGENYPPITLTVKVSCHGPGHVTNAATVTGGGDNTTHTATDPTTIERSHRCHGWRSVPAAVTPPLGALARTGPPHTARAAVPAGLLFPAGSAVVTGPNSADAATNGHGTDGQTGLR
ncbi:YVTN family beta-propeller repeat protein [Streptomyces mirabilis]|uniref:YVTN family beta-propeller repeat protein n=1 Tax=Streptomyces mirabilis TaxID=68239 RepID=UPI00331DBD35